jgi:hypothetical protein
MMDGRRSKICHDVTVYVLTFFADSYIDPGTEGNFGVKVKVGNVFCQGTKPDWGTEIKLGAFLSKFYLKGINPMVPVE